MLKKIMGSKLVQRKVLDPIFSQVLEGKSYAELVTRYPEKFAGLVKYMADTGVGTDVCLEHSCLPVPVHFYSPIPDIWDLKGRDIWNKRTSLPGLSLDLDKQVQFIKELGGRFSSECNWPVDPTPNPYDFYVNNTSFSYGCAASLYSMIRNYRPSKIIEVGSGNSSLVISQALSMNNQTCDENAKCQYTIIDPYPREIMEVGKLPNLSNIVRQRVELVEPELFDTLGENDVLFIDSSHSVKIGSDVNFLILEVLPRLAPGVIIHFHDIHLPFEYPVAYSINPAFRMFWTEAYLLQAFLAHNNDFEILLAMLYIMTDRAAEYRTAFPNYDPEKHMFPSGSFWIRRKA